MITWPVLIRGLVTGLSADLGGEDIARICIDCKADIIMVQNEQILKKVIYILPAVYTVIRRILVLIYSMLGMASLLNSLLSYSSDFRFC